MTADLQLSGPTVTLYGERDVLDVALSDELGRRGCSTHAVTIPVGWLASGAHAVVRLDTPAGEQALQELVSRDAPPAHVVAVCENSVDEQTAARLDALCRRCGNQHDVSLIWYPPLEAGSPVRGMPPVPEARLVPIDLAVAIADEIGHQEAWTSAPSFASQIVEPHRHRRHP